jgi:hypothetical protein
MSQPKPAVVAAIATTAFGFGIVRFPRVLIGAGNRA